MDRQRRHLAVRPRRQASGRHPRRRAVKGGKSAVKVWEARAYRDYDDQVELGTRNIKVALRRLRRFARQGAELELDLHDTIESTAKNAGWLDIKMVPERHNAVKVLMLLDVGGTMDEHIKRVEELFSAAKSELKHLEFYYFHNCVYESVWRNNRRRFAEKFDTWDVLRKYNPDWRLVFVGDATMSPYEILQPGGSRRAQQPGSGRGVDPALHAALPEAHLDQPRARGPVAVPPVDLARAAAAAGAHDAADARGADAGDAPVVKIACDRGAWPEARRCHPPPNASASRYVTKEAA